jgi:hypothetical protein
MMQKQNSMPIPLTINAPAYRSGCGFADNNGTPLTNRCHNEQSAVNITAPWPRIPAHLIVSRANDRNIEFTYNSSMVCFQLPRGNVSISYGKIKLLKHANAYEQEVVFKMEVAQQQ